MSATVGGERAVHSIPPVYDSSSRILILGSFPSVKSREVCFFYGHAQNRFWRVTAAVCGCPVPVEIDEKKTLLLSNRIALWDVIASCRITGSSDSSIHDVVPNDLTEILRKADIRAIFTNGKTADRLYNKFLYASTGIKAYALPSTSPANAAMSVENLIEYWKEIGEFLNDSQ